VMLLVVEMEVEMVELVVLVVLLVLVVLVELVVLVVLKEGDQGLQIQGGGVKV
jgi:hypothetical protein